MVPGVNAERRPCHIELSPALRRAIEQLPSQADIDLIVQELDECLQIAQTAGEGEALPEPGDTDIGPWKSGTEKWEAKGEPEIDAQLGLPKGVVPGMNTKEDPDGATDSWTTEGQSVLKSEAAQALRARWHQKVGLLRIMEQMFQKKPLLLMDGVGVGKTLQAICGILMYSFHRGHFEKHGHFAGNACRSGFG